MARPTKYPRWASVLTQNSTNKQYNIYEPPEQKKDIGWDFKDRPPRQWFNWLFSVINQWITYFDTTNNGTAYLSTNLPPASENLGRVLFVSNIDGGTLVFSNGTNWRKLTISGSV